jgi:hypothetical protein
MLQFMRTIMWGVLAVLAIGGTAAIAGPPPLDRPTPPACCADGMCYPNPTVWGVYKTRWRRWPTEELEPTPAERPPAGLVPEAAPFERPPAEEEDRAAPPRTPAAERAREEEEEDAATPPEGQTPGTVPLAPPGGLQTPLPTREAPTPPTLRMPWEVDEDEPTTEPGPAGPATPGSIPLGPTGDLDPPPAPPFRTPSLADLPATRAAETPADQPPPLRMVPAARGPVFDPPPAFPIAFSRQ